MKYKVKRYLDSEGEDVYVVCYKRYFWEFWKELDEHTYYNENTASYICSRLKIDSEWKGKV